jgi:hypothetical protein
VRRNTSLAVALAAVLALSALFGASMSSAATFGSDHSETNWSGFSVAEGVELAGSNCSSGEFTGTQKGEESSEVSVSPNLSNCVFNGQVKPVKWTAHGCKLTFQGGESESIYGRVAITGCESPMEISSGNCTEQIGNQTGLRAVEYSNTFGATNEIRIRHNVQGLKYTRSGSGCASTGTFTDGDFKGEWLVSGSAKGGGPAFIAVVPFPNIFTTEEGFKITPRGAPVVSQQVKPFKINVAGFQLECEKVSPWAEAESAGTVLDIHPEACKFVGGSVNVAMQGCKFGMRASGELVIGGTECAAKPMTFEGPGCKVTIGPQNVPSGAAYEKEGLDLEAKFTTTGLQYASSGFLCPAKGTQTNGSIEGAMRVSVKIPASPGIEVANGVFAVWPEPAEVVGEQVGAQVITVDGFANTCQSLGFHEITGRTTSLKAKPTFGGCVFLGVNTVTSMNGCVLEMQMSGDLVIGGSECATKPIEFAGPGCVAKIGPQHLAAAVQYENDEKDHGVRASISASSLHYTTTGFLCGSSTKADGTMKGVVLLTALSL